MIAVGKVDIGRRRERNEDGVFVSNSPIGPLPNIYIVADGMGGHKAGEIASRFAIDTFCSYLTEHSEGTINTHEDVLILLKRGIAHANHVIYEKSKVSSEYEGMGTTLTLCSVVGNMLYIAHVGDTRIYLLDSCGIRQVTVDHSLVQEMVTKGYITENETKEHPQRHIITRAVGTYENVKVDTLICALDDAEYILLCSDGLTSMLTDEQMHRIIYKGQGSLNDMVDNLILEANQCGGADNIAVVIGRREEVSEKC
ncbi:MAG: Stp1/IreP family PP2C-type Ser/Thr phosphatase [Cellulosilyticaceae bacterium]